MREDGFAERQRKVRIENLHLKFGDFLEGALAIEREPIFRNRFR